MARRPVNETLSSIVDNQERSIRARLREIRQTRGIAASELARRGGISRQTIYAIEDGTFVPNTAVSLRLAHILNVSVEQMFSVPGDEARDSTRRQTDLFRVAGCDPALSLLIAPLRANGIQMIAIPANSRCALEWLKQGRVHAAGSHLADSATGDYNLPIVRRMFPNAGARVVTFAAWEEGLGVRQSNPKNIRSFADLARNDVGLVNREKGAGSRDLLDSGLRKLRISPKKVRGYNSIAPDHFAAAYAVASGEADCCIVPRSVARCFGLDFVPLALERFDLSFTRKTVALPGAKAMLNLLNGRQIRRRLESIVGYDTSQTGDVLL